MSSASSDVVHMRALLMHAMAADCPPLFQDYTYLPAHGVVIVGIHENGRYQVFQQKYK